MSNIERLNKDKNSSWEHPKLSASLESWINKLSKLPLLNWLDPRPLFSESTDIYEKARAELELEKKLIDEIKNEFSLLGPNRLKTKDSGGYLLIELTDSEYYLLKPLQNGSSGQYHKKFTGKLVQITKDQEASEYTNRTLYSVFLLSETPLDPSDPDTEYETQFLPDGLTLLEEYSAPLAADSGSSSERTIVTRAYKYFAEGTLLPSSAQLTELPPLAHTLQTPTDVFEFLSSHPGQTPNPTRPLPAFRRQSSSGLSLTLLLHPPTSTNNNNNTTNNNNKHKQSLELLTSDGRRVQVDERSGRYVLRLPDGCGTAVLQHGQMIYSGGLAPDLSLDGIGQLVCGEPNVSQGEAEGPESTTKTIWQGLFKNGRIVAGEMETSTWRYTGGFDEEGLPHGNGKVMFNNMDVYEGEMKHSKLEGFGKYTFFGGLKTYTGQFQLDRFHGKGCMTFHDGSVFLGEFDNGKPRNGTLKASLSHFDIRNELWSSYGQKSSINPLIPSQNRMMRISTVLIAKSKAKLAQGLNKGFEQALVSWRSLFRSTEPPNFKKIPASLTPQLESGEAHQPMFLYEYEGEFNDDFKAHGNGSIRDIFGNYYRGTFRDGFKNGWGVFEFPTGERYTGEFMDDQLHGRGRLLSADSMSEFIGGFRFGLFDGVGKLKQNGFVTVGVWEKGTLTQVISHGSSSESNSGSYETESKIQSALQPYLLCLPEPIYWPILHRNYLSRSQLCHTSGRWNTIPQNDKSPKGLPPAFSPPAVWLVKEKSLAQSNSLILVKDKSMINSDRLGIFYHKLSKLRKWMLKIF